MLHRVREACAIDDEDFPTMPGEVEVDETYLGGKVVNHSNYRRKQFQIAGGTGSTGKQAIFGMRQRGGMVLAFPVPDTTSQTLVGSILFFVERGSSIYSDEFGAYSILGRHYHHETVKHSIRQWVNGPANTNSIESFWALLKRSYHGTYHWWSFKHSHRYVNETSFRLNQILDQPVKKGRYPVFTLEILNSLLDGASGKRLKYRELIL